MNLRHFRMNTSYLSILAIPFIMVCNLVFASTNTPVVKGYVLSDNRQIYEVDLLAGKELRTSKPINGLGGIANIAISPNGQFLYIASDRSLNGTHFDPLIVIRTGDLKVVNRFQLEPRYDLDKDPERKNPLPNAVYRVTTSPDGENLFVLDGVDPKHNSTAVLDSKSGHLKYRTAVGVALYDLVSPDGTKKVQMWPEATIERNGQLKLFEAGLAVKDIKSGNLLSKVILKGNQGFQPPWAQLSTPFIYYRMSSKHLLSYHRDTRQLLSDIDPSQLAYCASGHYFAALPNAASQVALVSGCNKQEGAVVVIDVIEQKLIHKIKVGPFPTNVVVAKH